jgi:hypothetical protein
LQLGALADAAGLATPVKVLSPVENLCEDRSWCRTPRARAAAGRRPTATLHALSRLGAGSIAANAARLQRAVGNRALARLLDTPKPLPAGPRAQMQAAFGAEFSDVRVHERGEAERAGAAAFAEGSDVHFAEGAIGVAYGAAMHAHHQPGGANAALDLAAQQMGVNEYAMPDVGEGIVTYRLGETVGGVVQDPYHARVENAPGDATLWRYHWGGVVAKDGTDYVTLENYARSAEDALGDVGGAPRFYFQMYGGGAQSWHEQWAVVHAGTRNFANPLTARVVPETTDKHLRLSHHRDRARLYFSGHAVDDHYTTVGTVTNADKLGVFLYKALAFAEDPNETDRSSGVHPGHSRTFLWLTAISGLGAQPFYAAVKDLAGHVRARPVQTADARYDHDAQVQYGANLDAVKDDYAMVATAPNPVALANQLRKGLAYANRHTARNRSGRDARVAAWRNAVAHAPQPFETTGLLAHTKEQLDAVRS